MPDRAAESAIPQPLDISTESFRYYTYADGKRFQIGRPVSLYLLDGGASHRVIDADGVTHRPERGWIAISWKPKDGAPPFVA